MSIPLFVSERSKPPMTKGPLLVGCLIFERMDQIDFTGPFEVLSRMPGSTVQIVAKEPGPIRDVQGLRLTPDVRIAEAGPFDVLLVPGGYGQQALMHDEEVLELIRKQVQREKLLFSVCTGALLCGASGVLVGRQVSTHWSARHLMPYYGAVLVDARVAVQPRAPTWLRFLSRSHRQSACQIPGQAFCRILR
jgi:cyclohexyl-isocyanide hydratase